MGKGGGYHPEVQAEDGWGWDVFSKGQSYGEQIGNKEASGQAVRTEI